MGATRALKKKRSVSVYTVSDSTTESSSQLSSESSAVDSESPHRKEQETSSNCARQFLSDCLFCICATTACGLCGAVLLAILTII